MKGHSEQSQEAGADRIELRIDSDPANLRQIRRQVEEFAKATGFDQKACDAVGLATNEALANVIRHGYGGETGRPILLTLERSDGELRLHIRDWAKPFDPAKLPDPGKAVARCPDELKPGGLGLLCMREVMDEVEYHPQPDGMLLTMKKRSKSSKQN
jgi:anti-sigma regulatory factor (Ser/Thr protein kinase)